MQSALENWLVTAAIASLLLAVGLWLALPRARAFGRAGGMLLVTLALGLLAGSLPGIGNWAAQSVFLILAATTVLSAVATITFRSPVYSAIWFAMSLLGTAGLFMFQGAQFLGVATIVVYAGAILVTFLFVLMLAQPKGQAFYDRVSWAPLLAALTGGAMVGLLTLVIVGTLQNPDAIVAPTTEQLSADILDDQHVARLGAQLFSKYLVGVEVAGTLLLVALIGAVAIVSQIRRPTSRGGLHHG